MKEWREEYQSRVTIAKSSHGAGLLRIAWRWVHSPLSIILIVVGVDALGVRHFLDEKEEI